MPGHLADTLIHVQLQMCVSHGILECVCVIIVCVYYHLCVCVCVCERARMPASVRRGDERMRRSQENKRMSRQRMMAREGQSVTLGCGSIALIKTHVLLSNTLMKY